ncbi:hypothetical protein [Tunturiibacter gelidiferens]|uniref:hypothetical protein n=1 Tax=Tunturiibacter gelidiferens TaxID=3069689 RepID=UPI003D9B1A0F
MRVALFGGSFDPPHHGHLAIATAAADAFALDSVFFSCGPAASEAGWHDNSIRRPARDGGAGVS